MRVDRPQQIGPAWDEVLSADRRAVLEAVTDSNVAPIPPHISLEQTRKFVSSVLKGDAQALGFLKQIAKDVAVSVVATKK